MIDIEEILENPAFWILGGGGIVMELIGWIISKRVSDLPAFPVWQLLILMFGTLVIAAIFANRG